MESKVKRITTRTLAEMKARKEPITMLTAYDYTFARLLDEAGIEVLLVGDSAANVIAGYETTLPITLDEMIYHGKAVVRGARRAMVVVDMPFGSYQGDSKAALRAAIRIMKETGAHAVKVEGGETILDSVQRIISAGIPVMGHLGLTPQSIYQFGGYRVRAREAAEAEKLRQDARLLAKAGIFALVLEKIPASLAKEVTESLSIPTIGIGAGVHCDGQVLVLHDMLGLTQAFSPRFLRRYADMAHIVSTACQRYIQDVKNRTFPSPEESYE
ncbi:MAG: 3-methyl-2-oxobutanoate hydroxymethyltransferase [Bacteroidia bacterium]|nr:3-methyl-2-oxobutanoate hydroxymethyltransferase [Bacteroidia bacterium]MDW8015131.1 3-methyl-2-oxobutanoate hydroxymethyltransferase [Bacteroidia bacterium]